MSISLAGLDTQAYVGQPFGQPVQIAGVAARAVKFSVNWLAYGAGSANQNILINANASAGAGTNQTSLLDLIRSVYIDNTGNPLPVFIQFPDTQFTVTAAAYSTGWYPVFTNGFTFDIASFGFTDANAAVSTLIYVTNINVRAYSDTSLTNVEPLYLGSPIIGGGGSSVASIIISNAGTLYNNGSLNISGGGGNGASARGILNAFGQFVGAVIDTPGANYLGQPVILPTGGQVVAQPWALGGVYNAGPGANYANVVQFNNALWYWNGNPHFNIITVGAPAWNSGTGYPIGDTVTYIGNVYFSYAISGIGTGPPPNYPQNWTLLGSQQPSVAGNWTTNGDSGGQRAAAFSAVLSAASQSIITSGLAPAALGDQSEAVIDDISGAGVIRNNLWGTPFASGFIYLTHIDVNALTVNAANVWTLQNALGLVPFSFSPQAAGRYLSLQKMNMKLDATIAWQLNCTNFAGAAKVSHAFAWTYSQQ